MSAAPSVRLPQSLLPNPPTGTGQRRGRDVRPVRGPNKPARAALGGHHDPGHVAVDVDCWATTSATQTPLSKSPLRPDGITRTPIIPLTLGSGCIRLILLMEVTRIKNDGTIAV